MDEKTLQTLEYHKILERLAKYCAFPASAEKARQLRPTSDVDEARLRQAETSEAVRLLDRQGDLTIGGARDVRGMVDLALHGGVLAPSELLDVKYTLVAARNLARTFERLAVEYPHLADIAAQMPQPTGIVDAVTRAISDHGEILDSASEKLENIRRELRIVHDRLLAKLQKMVSDPRVAPYLQESLVTLRDGRYVLPLRAEFKGRVKAIIHDQSASGATLFIEPLSTVEQNNQYRELQLAERDEERRILVELSHLVGQYAYEINLAVEIIAELDLVLARAKYAEELRACQPKLRPLGEEGGEPVKHPASTIRLYQARHPLLDSRSVVPIDVELGKAFTESGTAARAARAEEETQAGNRKRSTKMEDSLHATPFSMVITGPNTGGKTVTLKTVGLLALMAQSGLHIPTQPGSEISVFENIYADIGDEQSIEQSLSTFSGHITNIIRILERADRRSLVILDELGAGTDPQEGSALARALLVHLVERCITNLVTTHHPELKAFAHATPGVVNASVEFDLETLRPTYHLTIGLPGRSNALAIAQRLGLPEAIISSARSELNPQDLRAEDLLNEIHHQRDLARQARQEAQAASQEADRLRRELEDRLEKIEDERRKVLEEARLEAAEGLQVLHAEIAETRRALARARQPIEVVKELEEQVEALEEKAEQPVERLEHKLPRPVKEPKRAIRAGDRVRLRTLGAQGIVTGLSEEGAEVSVGMLRVRARLSDLELAAVSDRAAIEARKPAEARRQTKAEDGKPSSFAIVESPGFELDLRGKTSDEALQALDRYLDAAYLAGLPFVRIIHGKGTGKLRQVVRQALDQHPHVKAFEAGGDKEGGEGVTVAKLMVS